MSTMSTERQFSLAERVAIDVMCNERRIFRMSNQNVPTWEYYQNQFSNRFDWIPPVDRFAATEYTMQRDPLYHYQGAGTAWSVEDALAGGRYSSQFTDQQSDQFAMEFLEFEQAQQRALRQPVIGQQVIYDTCATRGMTQTPQITTQQQHRLRQPVIWQEVYGQHGMAQRQQIPTQQQQIPQQLQPRLPVHQQIEQALSRANSQRQSEQSELGH